MFDLEKYLGASSRTSGMTSLPMKMSSKRFLKGSSLSQVDKDEEEDSKLDD